MLNATSGNAGFVGGDFGIAGAGAEASVGEDGATLGAQASVLQGGVRFGENDPARANDTQVRIGVGLGGGGGGRLHWTDTDGDGSREYGFGADIGPVSFDLRSEDPLGAALSPAAHLVGEEAGLIDADTNLTNASLTTAADAWNHLTGQRAGDRTPQAGKEPD